MQEILTYQDLLAYAVELGVQMKNDIIARHVAEGQRTTGKTSATLRIDPTTRGFQFVGWKYLGSYEEGRKPGSMPPPEAITEWAKAKGIKFKNEAQARSFGFALALKIKREGTKRYRLAQAGTAPDILRTPIENMQAELSKVTSAFYMQEITRTLYRIDPKKKGTKI